MRFFNLLLSFLEDFHFLCKALLKGCIGFVGDGLCLDADRVAVDSAVCAVRECCCCDGGVFAAVDEAVVLDILGADGGTPVAVEAAGGPKVAVYIEGDGARGADRSPEVDAESLLGADEFDTACIHAADVCKVDGIGGRRAQDVVRSDGGDAAVSADVIGSRSESCMVRPKACVDLNGTRIDLGGIRAARVEPFPGDEGVPVLHANPGEVSCGIGLAASGGKDGAGGI